MKKELLITVMFGLLILPTLILAGPVAPSSKDLWSIIDSITNIIYGILLAVAVIFIITAGIKFISAGGEPEKVKTARDTVLWALVGIVVATAAVGVVNLIKNL
ncbi:hypothetical protein KJ786_03730 [Patescibacteria group bacterium]|nr:hypothetical protein [Patescibacteria group bacterium]